jgi:HlyD family secretion protein
MYLVALIRRYATTAYTWALAHKILSGIIIIALLWGGYWEYGQLTSTSGQTTYTVGVVTRGTVISTVSGSGQVSPSHQVTITPKASGEIVSVYVQDGQQVAAGQALAQIDATQAQQSVQNAQADLQSSQLSLQKLQEPADAATLAQSENQLALSQQSLQSDYTTSFNDIANTFLDLPSVMTGLNTVDFGSAASHGSQWDIDYYEAQAALYAPTGQAQSYRDNAYNAYNAAKAAYDANFADYQAASRTADATTTTALLKETYSTTQLMANAVKLANSLIQFYQDQFTAKGLNPVSQSTTDLSTLNNFTGKINAHLTALQTDTNKLQSDQGSVNENTLSLQKLQTGADPLDIQTSQLSIQQKQNALEQAQTTLDNYTIRAPFAGTLADFSLVRGDQVGSASVATEITSQQIADLSLNEVDAAKIAAGQKATLTFDAVPDLTLTGAVASVSPLGTVTQGVVSYDVKIGFTTQDPRVKAGMTVNADIETAVHQNVLTVPSSAIKTLNGRTYVQVFNPPLSTSGGTSGIASTATPQQVTVTTGISDDTNTEIISGVSEGQQIVTRTTGATATTVTTTSAAGGARGGGGGFGGIRLGG